jgi:hypothetical protein
VRQLERGEASALEVIDTLFAEELKLRENRRVKMALRMAKLSTIRMGDVRGLRLCSNHCSSEMRSSTGSLPPCWVSATLLVNCAETSRFRRGSRAHSRSMGACRRKFGR